jgi:catechol 2,3-dioxygenase-like lactoylglutathione lyase family enzyme
MPAIKVSDIAYVRLRAPDLDAMEEFLTHFGLVRAARTGSALYMRGTDPSHHIHVTEKGDPQFVGFAYHAAQQDDLRHAARLPGASAIESIDEPGAGRRVRLTEPNGYQIEIVSGIDPVPAIPITRQFVNSGAEPMRRVGEVLRLPKGPTKVKRLGHGVMCAPDVKNTVRWFREMLGLIGSDDVYAGSEDNIIGSFNRCDRGGDYVDHHVFFCAANAPGFHHVSFEVPDFDAVFVDHAYLKSLGKYEHMWGIGRHHLGSQVFDYWADPWGRIHEHFADSDRLNAADGSNLCPAEIAFSSQWGDPPPQKIVERVSP